jgi:lipooligosaccharide transport system permease protein
MHEFLNLSCKIAIRNWLVYKKDFFANISPSLIDPALFMIAFGFGVGHYISEVGGVQYIEYIAPGLVMSSALFTSFFESSYNFYVRLTYEGVFKALLTTPVGVAEIICGEFIWLALKGALMSLGVAIVLLLFGALEPSFLLWTPILGIVVAIPCGAIGLMATALVKNINQFQAIYAVLISPMFFFSGLFFPIKNLPEFVQPIVYLSPFTHGVVLAQKISWSQVTANDFLFHGLALILFAILFVFLSVRLIYPKLYK